MSIGNDHTRAPDWSGPERTHFRRCLAASAFLFVVYAIFSTGYLHPDEYFQTVEFASSKLGITDTADLPWEYREQMRSWLQPALYVVVGEAAEALGLRRPMVLLFVFRLVTGLVAWSALWTLIIAGNAYRYLLRSSFVLAVDDAYLEWTGAIFHGRTPVSRLRRIRPSGFDPFVHVIERFSGRPVLVWANNSNAEFRDVCRRLQELRPGLQVRFARKPSL